MMSLLCNNYDEAMSMTKQTWEGLLSLIKNGLQILQSFIAHISVGQKVCSPDAYHITYYGLASVLLGFIDNMVMPKACPLRANCSNSIQN